MRLPRLEKGTAVEIIWEDAHGADFGWAKVAKKHHKPVMIRTVGVLEHETDKGYTVVLSRFVKGPERGAFIFVPKPCVASVRKLA